MIYTPPIRTTIAALVLACIASSIVVGLLHEPRNPLIAWTSLAVAAVALLVVLATKRSPKRDAVLFMICGMGSGVFIAAGTVGFPGSLPMWLWMIGTLCVGTVAIVVDAESSQSKSVNRL